MLAVAAGTATPAFAAGTTAGSTITNNVTVNFQVGGVNQNSVSASNSFTVDRKVNFTVAEDGNATTPGFARPAGRGDHLRRDQHVERADRRRARGDATARAARRRMAAPTISTCRTFASIADTNNNGSYDAAPTR